MIFRVFPLRSHVFGFALGNRRWILPAVCMCVAGMLSPSSVSASEPTSHPASQEGRSPRPLNVLLICVDDLRPELKCFGTDYIQSPNIDALASKGVRFTKHYVQAPTCGASRYTLLTGRYGPGSNAALFRRADRIAKHPDQVAASMPAWFRQHGYTTVSVGKVSHHPGGRGGDDWDDDSKPEMPLSWDRHLMPCGPWQHPRGAMHGLAAGEIRIVRSEMDVFQSKDGADDLYPDGLILKQATSEIDQLTVGEKPFFLAVGFIRPHLPFGAPAKYMQPYSDAKLPPTPHPQKPSGTTTWHKSGEFMAYNRWNRNPNEDAEFAEQCRRHYAACVTYADSMVGKLLEELKASGQADNTIVILWGDHGWHLGEHAIWGKHALFEESVHSPLIVATPNGQGAGSQANQIVETLDIFPTVCDLCHLPTPETAEGESLACLLNGKPDLRKKQIAVSYGKADSIRTSRFRLIQHRSGHIELYDHNSDAGETVNVADNFPDVVSELKQQLQQRLANRD